MNRDSARKIAKVMLAYADGKLIQKKEFNLMDDSWRWTDVKDNEGIILGGDYRISPETKDSTIKNGEERYKEIKAIDWEQRRYDIVKDLVVQICHNDMNFVSEPFCSEDLARIEMAVHYADAIIEELKKKTIK